jgi:cytochrome c-type biogenesis protein CcmH/NrfG
LVFVVFKEGEVQDTLGIVLVKSGKVDEGLKALRQAASVLPDNPSIQYHLALALNEHKDTAAAAATLRKALALDDFPESVQAKTLLTRLNDGTERTK